MGKHVEPKSYCSLLKVIAIDITRAVPSPNELLGKGTISSYKMITPIDKVHN